MDILGDTQYYDINFVPNGHFFRFTQHGPVMCKVSERMMRNGLDTSSIYVPIPETNDMVLYLGYDWEPSTELN